MRLFGLALALSTGGGWMSRCPSPFRIAFAAALVASCALSQQPSPDNRKTVPKGYHTESSGPTGEELPKNPPPPARASTAPQKPEKKTKKPKPVSQPAISEGCVTVYDIRTHSLGILSGILAPEPGLEAKIRNSCFAVRSVFLRVGYFDSKGTQFGDDTISATVASGAEYEVFHQAPLYGVDRGLLKAARIIAVEVYQ